MNLQVCIPYRPCPFHCPMCIAADGNLYENLYKKDEEKYFKRLAKALDKTDGCVVLTGDTEPTLDKVWLEKVINFIKGYKGHKIELQTHNYNLHNGYEFLNNIDVVAYSFTTTNDLHRVENVKLFNGINRAVILATKPVIKVLSEHYPLYYYIFKTFNQITVKLLQMGNGLSQNVFVKYNACTKEEVYKVCGSTAWIDENCQNSKHRYRVFRENGKVYKHW